MAERRMFAKTIIDSDAFIDMPLTTQAFYFHLSMRADDDGFVNNPKKIQRMIGCSDDDMRLLIAKSFIIPFNSGVCVIKHWKIHNYIQTDRYKETVYLEEKRLLETKENKAYTLQNEPCIHNVYSADTQVRLELGEDRLGEVFFGGDGARACACEEDDISEIIAAEKDTEAAIAALPEDIRKNFVNLCEQVFVMYFGRSPTKRDTCSVYSIIKFFKIVHGKPAPEFEITQDDEYLTTYAFDAAVKANKTTIGYVGGVFRNFKDRGISTKDDCIAYEFNRNNNRRKQS